MRRLLVLCLAAGCLAPCQAQTEVNLDQQVRGELPVANGGTGGGDAAAARSNLGLNTDYLAEDHVWPSRQDVANLSGLRYAHVFADSGDGSEANPWEFAAGNPWAEAIADGGKVVLFAPGVYKVASCPSIIPEGVSIIGLNRESTTLWLDCHAIKNRVAITNAANSTPIQITTATAHGLSTGDRVRVHGVPGNNAANGEWQVTVADANNFTLDGSSGNGNFVQTNTGMWAGQIFRATAFSTDSPVEVTTATAHNFADGDRLLVENVQGSFSGDVTGKFFATVTAADKVTLNPSARHDTVLDTSNATIHAMEPVNGIETEDDVSGIEFRGFTLSNTVIQGPQESLFKNVIAFHANESVLAELRGKFLDDNSYDPIADDIFFTDSAAITFTGAGNPGDTIILEQTGGGSRASGAYPTFTIPGGTPLAVDSIDSPLSAWVIVTTSSNHGFQDGDTVTISSTSQSDNAGASGVWKIVVDSSSSFRLVGSSGTDDDCSSGCAGTTATETSISAIELASTFAAHLNSQPDFSQDYYAAPVAETVHILERKFGSIPDVFTVTTPAPHTTVAWATTKFGGNHFLLLEANSFSSRFSRILCTAVHPQFHCIGATGLNNQHTFRDIRLSGSNDAGWAMRLGPGVDIQGINVFGMTAESTYGALEIGSARGSVFEAVYMENSPEFGIRVFDERGTALGNSFVNGVTVAGSKLDAIHSLDLQKGRDITIENAASINGCVIGPQCENCTIRSSFLSGCTVESPSGYLEQVAFLNKPIRAVNRYGERLATPVSALLSEPVTNFALQSEDLTASPWTNNSDTALVSDTNPFGQAQSVSRTTVGSPTQFQLILAGSQTISGLTPLKRYGISFWTRVVTAGASCLLAGEEAAIDRHIAVSDADGWVRAASSLQADSAGDLEVFIRCQVGEAGLPSFSFDIFGVMIYEMVTDGALPPYIPTTISSASLNPGLFLQTGTVQGPLLQVDTEFRLSDPGVKPACDPARRFTIWVDEGAGGVKDAVEVCAKDSSDNYAWRTIF